VDPIEVYLNKHQFSANANVNVNVKQFSDQIESYLVGFNQLYKFGFNFAL